MCKILIHEPDAVISLHLKLLLKNHQVERSASFLSLIQNLKKYKYDLLIIDVGRIPGWTHLIRFIKKLIPVIAITSDKECGIKSSRKDRILIIRMPFNSYDIERALNIYHIKDINS